MLPCDVRYECRIAEARVPTGLVVPMALEGSVTTVVRYGRRWLKMKIPPNMAEASLSTISVQDTPFR